jgi:hypothetical protein
MGFYEFWLLMYVLLRNSVYGPIGFVPPGVINIYLSIYIYVYIDLDQKTLLFL